MLKTKDKSCFHILFSPLLEFQRLLFFAKSLDDLVNTTNVLRLEPHYSSHRGSAGSHIRRAVGALYSITRSLKRAESYSNTHSPQRPALRSAGHRKGFFNWIECKAVYIEITKGSFSLKKVPVQVIFIFSFGLFSDFVTGTFITFIIIYSKTSCSKMNSP